MQLQPDKTYALAVSGGADSMAMLDMFFRHRPSLRFFVVTVNHNLRENGQKDAEFVQNYCKKINVECKRFDLDVPSFCKENKVSPESGARILRYRVFEGLSCDYVCLAHQADDNAETVLMHVLRGSGMDGALGIKEVSGRYIRPVLSMNREQTEEYCRKHGVPFVTDETNLCSDYTRNYLRNEVMPLLKKVNPRATENLVKFADSLSFDADFINAAADISQVAFENGSAKIPKNLLSVHKAVSYRVIKKTFCRLGVEKDIEKKHVEAICALANADGGKRVNLPFGYVAVSDYDCVSLVPKEQFAAESFVLPFAVGETVTPFGTIFVSTEPSSGLRLDADKIPSGAVFRNPRQGDVFNRFGGFTKKLSRYLIDKKVPRRERSRLAVLAAGSDILAVCGMEISDSVKTDGNTSAIYYLTFTSGGK